MGVIRLEWPFLPPAQLRGNARAHHQVKAKIMATFKESALFRIMKQGPDPMDKVLVRYIGYCCAPLPDRDNLAIGMKGALDAFTEYGVIKDDSSNYVLDISTKIIRVPHRKEQGMVMEVEEASLTTIASHHVASLMSTVGAFLGIEGAMTFDLSKYETIFNSLTKQMESDAKKVGEDDHGGE